MSNILIIIDISDYRAPPAPPPRWPKPSSPNSPASTPNGLDGQMPNNFTVTTTVTFSVDGSQTPQILEVTSPNSNTTVSLSHSASLYSRKIFIIFLQFQTITKRLSPEGECKQTVDTLSSQGSKRWQSQANQDPSRKILSPHSGDETPTSRSRRSKARKESKHYQESDILESPQVYCRSTLCDKISDYEDLWTHDNMVKSPLARGPYMSSFRPENSGSSGATTKPQTRKLFTCQFALI